MTDWQDIVFSSGAIVLSLALLPSIFGITKPALSTSCLTAGTLTLFVMAFASLGLWYSAGANSVSCLLWLILAFQVWRKEQRTIRQQVKAE